MKLAREQKIQKIRAFAFDVDGVMTEGGLLADLNGEFFRIFDAKDSFGMRMAYMNGYRLACITGGRSQSIIKRLLHCGFVEEDIYLGSRDKIQDFNDFCSKHGLAAEEVMYIGDDLPDIPVMKACGIGACPADAVEEVIEAADYVSPYPGGKGCIRKTIEMVLKAQGKWEFNVGVYHNRF